METAAATTGARRLLRRLRDTMAGSGSAEARLEAIVRIIAADMVAEVCSCYVMRAGEVLELFATEGLNPSAVHRTRLRVSEGLVGTIAATARPLSLPDAQTHPNFAYRPETGEEIYHSLMGVPILRGGRVLGVIVVQNRTMRLYTEDEIETLETVAMVLAELVATGELVSPNELHRQDGIAVLPTRLDGVRLNAGLAIGTAVLHEPRIIVHDVVAEDTDHEIRRVKSAAAAMQSALDDMLRRADVAEHGEHRDVLEAYRMFAEDRGWLGRIIDAVRGGLTAEAAVQRVQNDTRARMNKVADPYLRERLHDLEDLAARLQQHLSGIAPTAAYAELPDDCVIVARSMGPAALLDYDRSKVKALVLEEGSPTAHVAVIARALDIPVLGRVRGLLDRVEPGDLLVVDGDNAQIFIRPGEDIQQAIEESLRAHTERRQKYAALRGLPAVSRDGVAVDLQLNAGLLLDLPHLDATGATGIGLYRTEIPFMVRNAFPDVAQQAEFYGRILDQAGERPVTFRTLDVGGDKVLPYLPDFAEENPAMGWRALRMSLDRPAMLRRQLRAMIRASRGRPLRLMLPMVAEVAELEAARAVLDLELERARQRGTVPPSRVELGVMLEVPSLVFQLGQLLPRVAFVSVGTNDLAQFLFAVDRGNPRVADRYDPLSPPMLRLLLELVGQCDAAGVELSCCGEMAGQPLDALALIGLGFRRLSMAPASIGPVKTLVREIHVEKISGFIRSLTIRADHSVRGMLRAFARDHGISL